MKAVKILGDASSPIITTTTSAPAPSPLDATEILVRVHAAGITGPEVTWPEVWATPSRIPGHDISGVVTAVGPGYAGKLKVGQEVYGMLHAGRGQGQAEFVVCGDDEVVGKDDISTQGAMSHAEAAALPIPLLTAWEALTTRSHIKEGMRVLVTGASGAVGVMFVQLAARVAGAHVIALASPGTHDMLRGLGAEQTVDYNVDGWERTLEGGGVDVVFDTVGGQVLDKTWEVIKKKGTIVTVGDPAPAWAVPGGQPPAEAARLPDVEYTYFIVTPDPARLREGARMIMEGSLKPVPTRTFPFSRAKEAWDCAQARGRGYKVVIDFSE